MTRAPRWAVTAGVLLAFATSVVAAEPTASEPPSPTVAAAPPAERLGVETPRGAVQRFLDACANGDYARAAEFLDLRKVPRTQRPTRGQVLAGQLEIVLDRSVALDPALLSDAPEGERDDDLPQNRDLLAIVETEGGAVELLLERGTGTDGTMAWRVSSDTVARIPDLYTELGYGPLADRLPAPLVRLRLFGIRFWQWLGLFVLVTLAVLTSWLSTRLLRRFGPPLLTRIRVDVRFLTQILGPLRLLIAVGVAAAGLPLLSLGLAPQRTLVGTEKALVIVAFTWTLLRAIDVLAMRAQRRFVQRRQLGPISMIPLGRRVLKIVVAGFAVMAALQNFGFNVTGIAAGLGIGGLAIALAAQKTVENLFGGVSLIADQPVRVGDFCRFGDTEGVVEDIGLRSTRVRTLDRTIVTIPNATFSAMPLENMSRRDRIPVRATLALKPDAGAPRVREILTRLRAMLAAQPKVEGDSARARFVRLGPQIEIEILAYVVTGEWSDYLEHREQLFLAALEVVGESAATLK